MAIDERDYMRERTEYSPKRFRRPRVQEGRQPDRCPADQTFHRPNWFVLLWVVVGVLATLAALQRLSNSTWVSFGREQIFPSSGVVYAVPEPDVGGPLRLVMDNGSRAAVAVVSDWSDMTRTPLATIYLRGGETVTARLEPGEYRLEVVTGKKWYGAAKKFGGQGAKVNVSRPAVIRQEGRSYVGSTLRIPSTVQ